MLIEAMACGVAVAASDSGEIPHVVRDAGLIVGERDGPTWLAALAALLETPAWRAELAARGLERSRSVFAWPVVARRHLDFFTELLEHSGPPSG
jgi:glycosyltransferase involved in cell wall biosynthesis